MLSPTAAFVQRHDPDRFLTALFAPAPRREAVMALYAFNHELARAREVASEPMLALIRLQWWREVVQGAARRHEVATPLQAALADGALDRAALLEMIAAREIEAEPEVNEAAFRNYLHLGAGGLMAEAGRAMGAGVEECLALQAAGRACGTVGLIRNMAAYRQTGRWVAPIGCGRAWLAADACSGLAKSRKWTREAIAAALPIVLARRWMASPNRGRDGVAPLAVGLAAFRRCC